MLTHNSILQEIKDVPTERLEELHQFISLLHPPKRSSKLRKRIMSFAGSFHEMSDKDYKDFLSEIQKIRDRLLDKDS